MCRFRKALVFAVLSLILVVGASPLGASRLTSQSSLKFSPMILLAPNDNALPTAGPYACVSPDGTPLSNSFHCYTPAQIYAAYGVDALHAEGTTGKGQTIVIVDSYGSPTVQQDLDKFSDTFGLPRTTIKIIYPYPTATWPASDPLVTSAGGTWLQYGWTWNPASVGDLSYQTTPGSRTEAVWNEPYIGAATGGGRSVLFPTPDFQSGISQSVLNGARGLPDLSWNAAVNGGVLVYTSFPGARLGWHIVGGTSAAAPQLAALVALTNQLADASGKAHVGYLNPLLYKLSASDFNDIVPQTFNAVTLADNGIYGSGIVSMPVNPGYDLSTGMGSPKAYQLVHDLASILP